MKTLQFITIAFWLPVTGIAQNAANFSRKIENGTGAKTAHFFLKLNGSCGISNTGAINLISGSETKAGLAYAVGAEGVFEQGNGKITLGTIYESCAAYLKFDGVNGENKTTLNFLNIPVQYKVYLSKSKTIYLGAGGYAAALLSTKESGRSYNTDSLHQWNFGSIVSGGVQLTSRLSIELQYKQGLTDLGKGNGKSTVTKNSTAMLTLGFTLFPAGTAIAVPAIIPSTRKSK